MRAHTSFCVVAATATMLTAQAHWTRLYPAIAPTPRHAMAMTFDAARDRCVVFGGNAPAVNAETWLFDGINWAQAQGPGPSARIYSSMAFDSTRNVVVLFGGSAGGNLLQDTWEWNGITWTQRVVVTRPPARDAAAIAYDPVRQRTVLFGGWGGTPDFLGDTWTWDGTVWQLHAPAHAPSARDTAMAFDPNTRDVLLFGGVANGSPGGLDDTWRWNGVDWQLLQPTNAPWFRFYHSMVTDLARRRVVLVGSSSLPDSLVWEWDGTNWEQRFLSSPTPRSVTGLAYDTARRQVILFGGALWGGIGNANDTWIYRTDSPADFALLGAGCAGSLGTPALTNAPYSLPWLGDLFTSQVAPVAANGPVFFVTGHAAQPPVPLDPHGMPGCTLFVSIIATDLRFATAAGVASWSLQIPNATSLAGVELAQQCLSLDSGNAAGAVVSSARMLRIGIR